MDMSATMNAPCPAELLFAEVDDLARYPAWLGIVPRAEPADVDGGAGRPVWSVELRGRIGRLARSKRLRMVRTVHEPPRRVRFEREERDGRHHAAWVLEAEVCAVGPHESTLEMSLHYGGSFGGALIEKLLHDEIEASRVRLVALVQDATERS